MGSLLCEIVRAVIVSREDALLDEVKRWVERQVRDEEEEDNAEPPILQMSLEPSGPFRTGFRTSYP